MNKPIQYLDSSMRFFGKNEKHVTRLCDCNVLVMVFEGVLRFCEDGIDCEIFPGEYFIQKSGGYQEGKKASDSPKYLYIHFTGEWASEGSIVERRGSFNYSKLKEDMSFLDYMAHNDFSYTEKCAVFYRILSVLHKNKSACMADKIADYISVNCSNRITLEMLCGEFHFSKNHIINIFKKEYAVTPLEYMNIVRVKKAQWLLEVTPKSAESIAFECGFGDYASFYKIFCRTTGMSPKKWRNEARMK